MNPSQTSFVAGLLPGNDAWPCAGDLPLEAEINRLAAQDEASSLAWRTIAGWTLPDRSQAEDLHRELQGRQSEDPVTFQHGLLLVYSAYYSHPSVLALIEQRCGYAARPPQPQGHPVVLAGPDRLPSTVGAAPMWREDGTERARLVHEAQAADPEKIWTEEEIATWLT